MQLDTKLTFTESTAFPVQAVAALHELGMVSGDLRQEEVLVSSA